MKSYSKKIIVLISIFVLMGTSVVTAKTTVLKPTDKPTLRELIQKWNELREKKEELHDMLVSYGVDVPDLTDEQKWIIWSTVWRLRNNGASKEEIRLEVRALLEEFGVEFPDLSPEDKREIRQWIKNMLETDYGFVFPELTEEQKEEIKQVIIDLKRQGLSREEIRQQIKTLLETDYGFVFPELTEEQKEEIRDRIIDMLETEYGLDIPDLTPEQSVVIKRKRAEIKVLQRELSQMLKNADKRTKYRFYLYVKRTMNPPPEGKDITQDSKVLRLNREILVKLINRFRQKLSVYH